MKFNPTKLVILYWWMFSQIFHFWAFNFRIFSSKSMLLCMCDCMCWIVWTFWNKVTVKQRFKMSNLVKKSWFFTNFYKKKSLFQNELSEKFMFLHFMTGVNIYFDILVIFFWNNFIFGVSTSEGVWLLIKALVAPLGIQVYVKMSI